MSVPVRLAAFAALLAVVFAVAWAAGAAIDPAPRAAGGAMETMR